MTVKTFIDRPILAGVISVLIVILGVIGLSQLPIEQFPNIAPPTVRVSATYTGANAETVLKSVIVPLEESINGVEDMMYMTSTATNTGTASINIYFNQGTDPDMAVVNVQNRVASAQGQLPAEVVKSGVTIRKRQNSTLIQSTKDFLDESIYKVAETLVIALILVILIVYLFLHDWRATLIPSISIVVSLIGTFAFLYAVGFTLNMLTLFAIVLVIGTVVDDSVVVVEAVQAKFEGGVRDPYQATVNAMGGLSAALITTTIVFMAVFIPVCFMGGTSGTFYRQFGLTMAVAVGISLVNAMTLCPALSALLMRPGKGAGEKKNYLERFHYAFDTSLNRRPEISRAYTTFDTKYPQYSVEVDAVKCLQANVSPSDVLSTLAGYVGGSYSSNLNRVYGSESLSRFNLFPSISVYGEQGEGYSSGETLNAIKEVAAKSLPVGFGYEFGGMSREEASSGNTTVIVFSICLAFIYLILAALYESITIPFAVIAAVPIGLAGCFLFARWWGLENNIYMQIGIIMLIGLLAKTAILLTEYASARRKEGMSLTAAAISAAKARFRPIIMTSATMVFGMLPLMFASGVGANGNISVGVGTVGGLIFGTLGLLFIVPVLFVVFQYLHEKLIPAHKRRKA